MSIEESYRKFMSNRILYACSSSGQIKIESNYFQHEDSELRHRRLIHVEGKIYVDDKRGWCSFDGINNLYSRLHRCYRVFQVRDAELSYNYSIKLMKSITKDFGIKFIVGINAYALHTLYASDIVVSKGIALELSRTVRKKPLYKRYMDICNTCNNSYMAAKHLYDI